MENENSRLSLSNYLRLAAVTNLSIDAYRGGVRERVRPTDTLSLLHAVLGMASELGELQVACSNLSTIVPKVGQIQPPASKLLPSLVNAGEELGDIWWYWALAISSINLENCVLRDDQLVPWGPTFPGQPEDGEGAAWLPLLEHCLLSEVSALCDTVKKHLFYGRNVMPEAVFGRLGNINGLLLFAESTILPNLMVEMGRASVTFDLRKANIAKLHARYGDKFSEQQALCRDLHLEDTTLRQQLGLEK